MHFPLVSIPRWASPVLALSLAACGGGSSDGPASPTGPGEARLYIGYYAEDPANNPEDPTIGALMFRVPGADGPFAGQMPFSFVGCSAGIDTGSIQGGRSGSQLDAQWSGVMDGTVPVGGSFSASYDDATDSYAGSYVNAGGKVAVSNGPCQYHIAAGGSLRVWGSTTRQPSSFAAAATSSPTPTFTWSGLPSGTLATVRVFDAACVEVEPGDTTCFVGESVPTATGSITYPGAFPGATSLQAGTQYLVLITAQHPTTGAFVGFSSLRFTPATAGGGGGSGGTPDPDPGTGVGELTIGNLSGVTRFAPSGPASVLHSTEAPTCIGSGALSVCSSLWTTQWSEPGGTPGAINATLFVQVTSSSTTRPGPAPGSQLDMVTIQFYDARNPTLYRFQCGTTPTTPCGPLPGGLSLDLDTRTVSFQDTVLRVFGAGTGTGSITLTGSLGY